MWGVLHVESRGHVCNFACLGDATSTRRIVLNNVNRIALEKSGKAKAVEVRFAGRYSDAELVL